MNYDDINKEQLDELQKDNLEWALTDYAEMPKKDESDYVKTRRVYRHDDGKEKKMLSHHLKHKLFRGI